MPDSLGDRMKSFYEDRSRVYLTRRTPVIVRVDGRAFHTLTKTADKPFDSHLIGVMTRAAIKTANDMQGFKLGYVQSDEASFLLLDTDTLTTEAWFDLNLQKIVSISASLMTAYFNRFAGELPEEGWVKAAKMKPPVFDARAFNLPTEEVANYFLWRQKDWWRNSVQMLSLGHFRHKELQGKGRAACVSMLEERGVRWDTIPEVQKNGTYFTTDQVRHDVRPEFQEIRDLLTVSTRMEGW